ncbi:hypothetical protein [Anatilimnocola floriformis]|uniref:hypothetical protein n=1 Tax=Anatilimnocola floriformis TaxID=2948575 RepID=UPI0020C2B21D|nr:hypothetical protein [Anatilimnocola floriformis]
MLPNPYESPRGIADDYRVREPNPVPAIASTFVIPSSAALGGAMFFATVTFFAEIGARSIAVPTAVSVGVAAIFCVLMGADNYIQQRRPAFASAVIGMLLAAPVALVLSVYLMFEAYGLATKNIPGATPVAMLGYASFFLTLSFGGWLAVCQTRKVIVLERVHKKTVT